MKLKNLDRTEDKRMEKGKMPDKFDEYYEVPGAFSQKVTDIYEEIRRNVDAVVLEDVAAVVNAAHKEGFADGLKFALYLLGEIN